jgi:integrase
MRGHARRHGASWTAVWDIGRDEDGRRRQKWKGAFPTKKAAEAYLRDQVGKVETGDWIEPSTTPLADYISDWIARRVEELAELSIAQYRTVVRNHVKGTVLGSMPLGSIRRAHVRAHDQALKTKGLAVSTRNVVRAVINRALADALEDGLIASNPAVGSRRKGDTRKRPAFTVWSESELRDLLAVAADDRLAAFWRLAVATGMRRGELIGCSWLGYSREQATIEVFEQVIPGRGGPTIAPCKTKGSHRKIRLDSETVAALERHREAQAVERALAGDCYMDRDLIFCDELGGVLNPQRVTEAFAAHREAAGIRPGRLHDIRHSVATHLLTRGTPVHIIAARLGHSSPIVTMSTYAHVLPRSDEQAANVMAEVLA